MRLKSEGVLGAVELGMPVGGGMQDSVPPSEVCGSDTRTVVATLVMRVGALARMMVEVMVCVLSVGLINTVVDGLDE